MQYKTIILELIRQNEPLHDRLRSERTLLMTVERMALEFKNRYLEHLRCLTEARPRQEQTQLTSQAFEAALKEMEERLLPGSQNPEDGALSPDDILSLAARSPNE